MKTSNILITGSIGIDTIITPFGKAGGVLGGSATYFSLASRFYAQPSLCAVAGTDLQPEQAHIFKKFKIDSVGLQIEDGETFRWTGEYHLDLNTRTTLETKLGVLATFNPLLPDAYKDIKTVFLGNLHPAVQLSVLKQMKNAKLIGLDTMNFWMGDDLPILKKVIAQAHIFVINDEEARQLSGVGNILHAARAIQKMQKQKNSALIIKRGEFGLLCFFKNQVLSLPGFPLENVVDPTGAGDSFAGGLMSYLAGKPLSLEHLKQACAIGSTIASFAVEDFSTKRLEKLTASQLQSRLKKFHKLSHFTKL